MRAGCKEYDWIVTERGNVGQMPMFGHKEPAGVSNGLRAGRLHIALRSRSFFRQLHCSLELWRFLFDAEVVGIEILDLCHVVRGEWRTFGRLGEFNELFFVINVRQRRSDSIVREQPLQSRLPEGALGIFQGS